MSHYKNNHLFIKTVVLASVVLGTLWSPAEATAKTRAAPIYNLKAFKSSKKIISKPQIRNAAVKCVQDYLARSRPSGVMSIADWNRVDPKSVKLLSVKIIPAKYGFNQYKLRKSQVKFEAKYKVKMGRELESATLYLRSEMDLGKKVPKYKWRTSSPDTTGGVRTQPFSKADSLTLSWID